MSAQSGEGIDALWRLIVAHHDQLASTGDLARVRDGQRRRWMWAMVEEGVMAAYAHGAVRARMETIEAEVASGALTPGRGGDGAHRAVLSTARVMPENLTAPGSVGREDGMNSSSVVACGASVVCVCALALASPPRIDVERRVDTGAMPKGATVSRGRGCT